MKNSPSRYDSLAGSNDGLRHTIRWVAVVATVLLVQHANAALYLQETFDYPPGGLSTAAPWSTNGTLVETIPTQAIVPGDLEYPPLTQSTVTNNSCLQWSLNVKGERAIPGGPYGDLVNGSSIYCSFMFCKTSTNFSISNLPIAGMCPDNLNTLNSANVVGGVVLNIKSAAGGAYQLGVKLGGGVSGAIYPTGGQTYTCGDTNTAAFGQTNFVVMKYTFVPGSANDTVALWVNPDPSSFGGGEPAAAANDVPATSSGGFTADAASGLGFFQIRGGSGTTAGILQMDNLRIGSTWADVTPTCITAGIGTAPTPQAVSPGQTATFSVVATGANPTYQWQTNNGGGWVDVTGATNANYTTAPQVLGNNGLQFRVTINVACDSSSVTSSAVTLTVQNCVAASTTDPADQTVNAGSTATFSVVGSGTNAKYQWQLNSTGTWGNIFGATNASYTTPTEPVANNGFQFRCVVTVACNSSTATSAAATLTVVCNTAQVSSLQNVTVVAGQTATFSVTSGSSNPNYQWATNNGSGFVNIPGATNASYTTPPTTADQYGLQFQCTVSVACDASSTSTAATLLVNCFTAGINTDIANTAVSVGAGQTVRFSITGSGSLPVYQWQTNNGASWVNIAGATNANYTTPPLLLANNGLQYQCVVTTPCDGATATSSVATVSVYSDNAKFLSVTSGNLGDPNTWEQSFNNGNTFNNPAFYAPADVNSTNTVVQSGHTVTVAANTPLAHAVVQSGGQLAVNTNTTLTITTNGGAGTELDILGVVDVTGTLNINTNALTFVESGGVLEAEQGGAFNAATNALTFKSGAVYRHNYTTGGGTIPTATWNTGSSCEFIGFTSSTATLAGLVQAFYNFTWNCPNQTAALPWGGSVPTINGDFNVSSTGTGEVRISNNNSPTMNILGNANFQGGRFVLASGTGKVNVNVSGNVVFSGGTLSNSTASTGATINFVKAGAQSFANNSPSAIVGPINWVIRSNAIVQCSGVISSNLTLAVGGTIRVTTNAPLFQVQGNLGSTNGTVMVDLGGATLGHGTYPLMTYLGSMIGFLNSTPVLVNGSVSGVAYISTATPNQVNLVVASPTQPRIASFGLSGTALNLSAINGLPGDSYAVLATTNVALPASQWTPVLTHGTFDGLGNASTSIQLSNTISASVSQQFFRIQMPSP